MPTSQSNKNKKGTKTKKASVAKNSKGKKPKTAKSNKGKNTPTAQSHALLIRGILLFVGFLSLINVGFMYTVANPTIGFTLQAILSIALIFYAIFFKNISRIVHVAILIMFLIPLAFSIFLGVYGSRNQVNYTEDVVIVLGAGVNGTLVSRPLAHRLNATVDYWQNNPDALIIVTGGMGNRAIITEAEAMKRFLIWRGIPEEVILLEEHSTSTYENLVFAKEIATEHFPDGFQAVLVTNDFHIYRATRLAGQIDVDVHPLGARTDWYSWPVNYLREILAIINFMLFQR